MKKLLVLIVALFTLVALCMPASAALKHRIVYDANCIKFSSYAGGEMFGICGNGTNSYFYLQGTDASGDVGFMSFGVPIDNVGVGTAAGVFNSTSQGEVLQANGTKSTPFGPNFDVPGL